MMKNEQFYGEILEYQNYMKLYEYQLENQSELNSQESSVEQESDELKFYVDRFNLVM